MSSRRTRLVLLGLTALVTTSLAAVPAASAAPGAALPPGVSITAETPYPHASPFSPDQVYGAGSGFPGGTRVFLHQFYGGQWHSVSWRDADGSNGQRVIVPITCSGKRTPYRFRTLTRLTTSAGVFTKFSGEAVLNC